MIEIAVLSGKGGTGKTSLSAAFATLSTNMVVADCDVDAANLYLILQPQNFVQERFVTGYKAFIDAATCTQCGVCADYCRFQAIDIQNGIVTISETSCDGCILCSRICPSQAITMIPNDKSYWYIGEYRNGKMVHARLHPGEENSGKLVNVVREQAKILAKEINATTIIIDGPPGTGCPVISSLIGVNKVVVVTEPSISGFHDMKRLLELITVFKVKPYVIINKFDLNSLISDTIEEWCNNHDICLLGKLPFDDQIVKAMINCKSVIEWQPESFVSKQIISFWKKILCDE